MSPACGTNEPERRQYFVSLQEKKGICSYKKRPGRNASMSGVCPRHPVRIAGDAKYLLVNTQNGATLMELYWRTEQLIQFTQLSISAACTLSLLAFIYSLCGLGRIFFFNISEIAVHRC